MKSAWIRLAALAAGCLVGATRGYASALLYTNSPCVYLLASNGTSQTATLLGPTGAFTGSLTVPVYVKSSLFNVTAIAPGAFKDCAGLTALTLDTSSKVKSLGAGAFWGCTNLSSVTLSASVTDLGPSAFLGCSALTNVNLSVATGLTAVAEQTFSGCSALASIAFPGGVTNLGESAVRNCSALTAASLPSGVTAIQDSAFQGCRKLTSATFAGAAWLGVNAFAGTGLASVTIPAGLPALAQGVFADCTNLAAVSYAGAPTSIGSAAFKNCSSLTSLPVASSLSAIASTAFDGCIRLKSVALPAGVGDISDNLFENCTSLVAVTVGGAVSNVGEFAFACCPSLTNVTSLGDAPDADHTAFTGSERVFVYYFKGADGWGNLLAERPTVMLGADGSTEALSFAAWAVRRGLTAAASLSDAALAALFAAESPSSAGLANGSVYAFGSNLTAADQGSLLRIYLVGGTPVIEAPALDSAAAPFVTVAVEGTSDLSSGTWLLAVNEVPLADVTRAGYSPARVNGLLPACAFFRLKLALGE